MFSSKDGADGRYMCRDPKQIKFAPLNRDTEHTAEELMTIFEVLSLKELGLMIARPTSWTIPTSDQGCACLSNHLRFQGSGPVHAPNHQLAT
jgi:hypothetical protein